MEKLYIKRKVSTVEARGLFVDATKYNEFEILGYYRIVRAVYKTPEEFSESGFNATRIKGLINSLREKHQEIIYLRFWRCCTLKKIGEKLGITKERVRQLQRKALRRLELSKDEFLAVNGKIEIEKKHVIIKEIKRGNVISCDLPLSLLRLSTRAHNALKEAKLYTIKDLLSHSEKELLQKRGIGKTIVGQINFELANFVPGLKLRYV